MIPYKERVNIACADARVAEALARYLKYCCGFEEIIINPLINPFRFPDAFKMAEQSDLLIVDAFMSGEPKGFHFARQIAKKTLLLFYSGELDIENEGLFWLVLPYKLNQLKKKIEKIMQEPEASTKDYLEFEENFPSLKENSSHHF